MTDAERLCQAAPTSADPFPEARVLFSARDLLAGSLDYTETAEQIARLAVPRLAEQCTVYVLEDPGTLRAVGLAHIDSRKEAAAREIRRRFPVDPSGDHVVARVLREGRPRILAVIDERAWACCARNERHLALLQFLNHRSGLAVPLEANDRIIGVLTMATSDPERRFSVQDLIDAEDLARRAALAIENARLHEELRRSQERYRAFVGHSTEGIWCCELEAPIPTDLPPEEQVQLCFQRGYLNECNDVMARMYGFETADEILGARLADLVVPTDPQNREFLLAFVRAGYRLSDAESHEGDRKGDPRYFSNSLVGIVEEGWLLRVWGTQRDITERKQVEERLRRAERLDVVGRLAGGVAHDFNNMLSVILGYSELCLNRSDVPEPVRRALQEILSAGTRAASLTAELLAFGRKQFVRPRKVDLTGFLSDAEVSLQAAAGPSCDLSLTAEPGLPAAYVDPDQLFRIAEALVANAAATMPLGGPIAVRLLVPPGERPADTPDRPRRLCLMVCDQGPGLDEETRARLFEPFFTTLSMGMGSGLGLATVHGWVEQNGGSIDVQSTPGAGTTFRILLPVAG